MNDTINTLAYSHYKLKDINNITIDCNFNIVNKYIPMHLYSTLFLKKVIRLFFFVNFSIIFVLLFNIIVNLYRNL